MTAKEQYHAYLRTDEWRAISNEIKSRAKYRCQICNSRGPLNTHHRTYENLYRERDHMEDLVCLCEVCHERHHFPDQPKVITKTIIKTVVVEKESSVDIGKIFKRDMKKLRRKLRKTRQFTENEIKEMPFETMENMLKLFKDGLLPKLALEQENAASFDHEEVQSKMPPGEGDVTLTKQLLHNCMTPRGGFRMKSVNALGVPNMKSRWLHSLIGKTIPRAQYRNALIGRYRNGKL